MNMNDVQQGGFHIGCANKEIDVFTIGPKNEAKFCVDIIELTEMLPLDEEWTIRRRKMSAIEFENLTEFKGF